MKLRHYALSLSLLLCACQNPMSVQIAPTTQPPLATKASLPPQTARVQRSGGTETLRARISLPRGFGVQFADSSRLAYVQVKVRLSEAHVEVLENFDVGSNAEEVLLTGIPVSDGSPRLVTVTGYDSDDNVLPGFEAAGYYVSSDSQETVTLSLDRRHLLLGKLLYRLISDNSPLLGTIDLAALQTLLETSMDYDADLGSFRYDPSGYDVDEIYAAINSNSGLPSAGEIDAARTFNVRAGLSFSTPNGQALGEDLYLVCDDPISTPTQIPAGTASGTQILVGYIPHGDWTLSFQRADGTVLASTGITVSTGGSYDIDGDAPEPSLALADAAELLGNQVANTYVTGEQDHAAVALDDSGAFALAWFGASESDDSGISLRFYGSDGQAETVVLAVNQSTTGSQAEPAIAVGGNGNAIVVWEDQNATDGNGTGVFGRIYGPNGTALSNELRLSTFTMGDQTDPDVAADADGNFIVTWDDGNLGVMARRFSASGQAVDSTEFTVAAYSESPEFPSVAMNADGEFALAWGELSDGIKVRAYTSAASPVSGVQEASDDFGLQYSPDVAIAPDGGFVVTWHEIGPAAPSRDGSGQAVYARQYASSGLAIADASFQVNSATTGDQSNPAVAMNSEGGFTIAWTSVHETPVVELMFFLTSSDVYFQRYNAAGETLGAETRINDATSGNQHDAAIGMNAAGQFTIGWGDDFSQSGQVVFQRYSKQGLER